MECERVVFRNDALPTKFFRIFESMKRNGECCDININFGACSISAHRIVLFAAFPCFKDMFSNQEDGRNVTSLEIEPSALESLIDFAYSCHLEITSDNVEDLLSAALHLQADDVRDACCDFLLQRINPQNAMKRLEFAENLGCSTLVERCKKFIRENFDQVSSSEGFLHASFTCLRELISTDDLTTSGEEKVYEAVINWEKQCPGERKSCLPELLRHVRLTFLTPDYLKDRIAAEEDIRTSFVCRDLLDEAKYYHLLPERRDECSMLVTTPRKRMRLDPEANSSQNGTMGVGIYAISKHVSLNVQHLDLGVNKWKTLETQSFEVGTGTALSTSSLMYFVDTESLRWRTIHNEKWDCDTRYLNAKSYASTAVLQNRLYICGGSDGNRLSNAVLCFDLGKSKYNVVPHMQEKRLIPGVVALEQCLYVFGGRNAHFALRSVERYDPTCRTWTTLSPMKIDRYGLGCCTFNGKIYVCGGKSSSCNQILNSVEVYDPLKNQWNYISSMKTRRAYCSLVSDGRNIYAIGGYDDNRQPLNSVEIYDPHSSEWTFGPCMDTTQKYVRAVSVGLPAV